MARLFNGTNENIVIGAPSNIISSTTPISFSAWIWTDNLTADHAIMSFESGAGGEGGLAFYNDDVGSISGRTDTFKVVFEESGAGGSSIALFECATNAAKSGQWQHVFFSAEMNVAGGLQVWIDGAEDANSPVSTSSVNDFGGSSLNIYLGTFPDLSKDRAGKMAEVAFWNRVLTDSEIVALSKGFAPTCMRNGLIHYLPLAGRNSTEPNLVSPANNGTLTGTAYTDHPRIIYPSD